MKFGAKLLLKEKGFTITALLLWHWRSILFLIAAIIVAIIGFGVLVSVAAAVAKIVFFVLIIVLACKLIASLLRRA